MALIQNIRGYKKKKSVNLHFQVSSLLSLKALITTQGFVSEALLLNIQRIRCILLKTLSF